jgi:hypothetical protein
MYKTNTQNGFTYNQRHRQRPPLFFKKRKKTLLHRAGLMSTQKN